MEKVIIISYTAKSEGLILKTNIPSKLKTGNIKSKEFFVSWDKIGKLLFEDYTELDGFDNKYCMPDNINSKEEHEEYLKAIGYKKS